MFHRGVKEILQKRLKSHIKREKLAKAKLLQKKERDDVHYYCVIDFECTCEQGNPADYEHEIIEFPAILVNAATFEVVSGTLLYILFKPALPRELINAHIIGLPQGPLNLRPIRAIAKIICIEQS